MINFLLNKWNYQKSFALTLNILMGRISVNQATKDNNLSRATIKKMISEITPVKKINMANNIVIYKDIESVYLDHNIQAGKLGPKKTMAIFTNAKTRMFLLNFVNNTPPMIEKL